MSQAQQAAINSRITRKLEGGRPHKVYDYMFIQMSMEQFIKEYAGRKILIMNSDAKREGLEGPAGPHGQRNFASMNAHHPGNQASVSPRGGLIYQG